MTLKTSYIGRRLRRFVRATQAVSALEYAILVGAVAVAIGAALVTFSGDVQDAITGIGDEVSNIGVGTLSALTPDTDAT